MGRSREFKGEEGSVIVPKLIIVRLFSTFKEE